MFFIRLISYTPLNILYVISDFLYFVSYHILRYRRKQVWKNLQNSFPDKTDRDRLAIQKEFYKNLCDYAVETLKLLTISQEELRKRMVFKTPALPERYAGKNQSIIILASHIFNWEWLLTAACCNLPYPIDFVYQKVNSEFFERISLTIRTRFGAFPIERSKVARQIIARKNILRGIAMMADQYPGHGEDKKYQTNFLNQDTIFFLGTNQVAGLTQYPVLYYQVKKLRRGYYEARVIEIATPPYEKNSYSVIEKYVRMVEVDIRENPAGWLWSHNRWKKRHIT